jgi:glycerol uptake facilitator-like aquaporin
MSSSSGKHFGLALAHEFIGCVLLGYFINIAKYSYMTLTGSTNPMLIFLNLFLVWLPYAFAYRVSGGHLNPAITIVNMLRMDGNFNWKYGLAYIPVQILGHMGGIFLGWWYFRSAGELQIYKEVLTDEDWYLEAFSMEVFAGLIFALIFLLQSNHMTAASPSMLWQTLIISFTWVATYFWSYRRTGGSNNPAYGIAQTVVDAFDDGNKHSITYIWLYIICPIIGALIAWALYQFVYVKAHEQPVVTAVNKI